MEAAKVASSKGGEADHAALQNYLRENMLFQQRKLQEFLANGGGNGP